MNTVYERNFKLLKKLIPGLWSLEEGETLKSCSPGYMDLHLEVLRKKSCHHLVIALSHYYHHPSGDLIPDPDMEIKLYPDERIAEALTYRDGSTDYRVYAEKDRCYTKLKKHLNDFLCQWLTNCLEQGHQLKRSNPTQGNQKTEATDMIYHFDQTLCDGCRHHYLPD